ncbi:MAG TPA: hypothetical protein VFZ34_30275 [Blastocatellia bacterium]|nr:hypothetical protein [Blastocatellia bacterium]
MNARKKCTEMPGKEAVRAWQTDNDETLDARFIRCKSASACRRRGDARYTCKTVRWRLRTPHRASHLSH